MGSYVNVAFYGISPDSILRAGIDGQSTSKGLLVSKHYENVVYVLQIVAFMRDDKVYESIASYWHEDKDLEGAPHLEKVLFALEDQLDKMTDGEYKAVASLLDVKGDDRPDESLYTHKYWGEMNQVWWEIHELRDGKYHESDSVRYQGRRGIPRISTVGKRLCDLTMDLIWKMDNDLPNKWDEVNDALRKWDQAFSGTEDSDG